MNLPLKIARRYLFAKKSTNAINIISGISILGLSIGTAALILVLSVFNGFEDLIFGLFSNFNPDVKVTPLEGKVFEIDSSKIYQLSQLEGVEYVAQSLEETAFFEYKESQDFGILKGVDKYYNNVTRIDSTLREGQYSFEDGDRNLAVVGVGIRNKLSINIDNQLASINVYMPKRKNSGLGQPFKKRIIYPVGTFVIQQDVDNQYILTSLKFVQKLIGLKNKISALEIKLVPEKDKDKTIREIQKIVGTQFLVKDRFEQDAAFFKLMNIEKWMSFAILSLTLVLVAFNLIGALWMIVLDKKKDISILKSMGATDSSIRNIFLNEGLLISFIGMLIGFFIALALYFSQKHFGLVPIPEGFVVNAYPISIRLIDFVVVGITVAGIGLIASYPAAMRAVRISALIRDD